MSVSIEPLKKMIPDRIKTLLKVFKIASVFAGTGFFASYHFYKTLCSIDKIINSNVLSREVRQTAEYIYIDDPAYELSLKREQDKEAKQPPGFTRIWKSLKHSLAWRLLWLCRHGNREQRNIALDQLAAFKNNKDWDCLKLAQAMDKNTAVLLARTKGVDIRYFLPPPVHIRRVALSYELLSFKFRDILIELQKLHNHSCIQHFLESNFANFQEQAMEADHVPSKPNNMSERDLCIMCLDALNHHLMVFHQKDYEEDLSTKTVMDIGLLAKLAELFLRNPNDSDIDLAILRILTILSIHTNLLSIFFETGLIRELSRLMKSKDLRLSSSAAVCLANLSGEQCYQPGLYLLHPIYRTRSPTVCDTLLVHGLQGGVFVTWRQRDRKCGEPLGILDTKLPSNDCEPCKEPQKRMEYLDPETKQVMEDIFELEDEATLVDFDVVLHDLPIVAKRETVPPGSYTALRKREALIREDEDKCVYTFCWPKDWIPQDCKHIRILGVNYWTSISEWLERCPLQTTDISTRANDLAPSLLHAGVGFKNRSVVWLSHSMGGLIVKELLVEAAQSEDPEFKKLCNSTKAVIFFSTPHLGSALAKMPRAAAALFWPSNDVRQLEENSPTLLDLNKDFLKFADIYGWETISFAESKPTLVTSFKVPVTFVTSTSADLGRGVYYEMPLDHLTICKPATRQSILYTTVLDVIKRATADNENENMPPQISTNVSFLGWLLQLIWWQLRKKVKRLMETIDNDQSNENLHWFDQFILDTFTDGFTD